MHVALDIDIDSVQCAQNAARFRIQLYTYCIVSFPCSHRSFRNVTVCHVAVNWLQLLISPLT